MSITTTNLFETMVADLIATGLEADLSTTPPVFGSNVEQMISDAERQLVLNGYRLADCFCTDETVFNLVFGDWSDDGKEPVILRYFGSGDPLPMALFVRVADNVERFRTPTLGSVWTHQPNQAKELMEAFDDEYGPGWTTFWVPTLKGSSYLTP